MARLQVGIRSIDACMHFNFHPDIAPDFSPFSPLTRGGGVKLRRQCLAEFGTFFSAKTLKCCLVFCSLSVTFQRWKGMVTRGRGGLALTRKIEQSLLKQVVDEWKEMSHQV
jgi:hypothetical protein